MVKLAAGQLTERQKDLATFVDAFGQSATEKLVHHAAASATTPSTRCAKQAIHRAGSDPDGRTGLPVPDDIPPISAVYGLFALFALKVCAGCAHVHFAVPINGFAPNSYQKPLLVVSSELLARQSLHGQSTVFPVQL